MDFCLFLLLNVVLLVRPEELYPPIAGARLYLIVICLCVLTAFPRLAGVLQPDRLAERPITLCVIGVWAASVVSQLARGQIGTAFEAGTEFGKVMVYYLLLVSVIDSPARLRSFLAAIVALVLLLSGLGLLQYHNVIDIEALQPLERREYGADGEQIAIQQLQSSGIYSDPNDLCLILVTGTLGAVACSATASGLIPRLIWLLPIGQFGYAVVLTQSRGGLLGLALAVVVWVWGRFGWKRALPFALVGVPAMLMLAGGRQSNINLGEGDTAHQRVELWSDGFNSMMRNPLTGIGYGEYAEECGLVAHNSFVHAYVELGVTGGALFLAPLLLGGVALQRIRPTDPLLLRLRPFVLAILVGYAGGIFSISRNYVVPTYLVFGLADAYLRLAVPFPPPKDVVSWPKIGHLMALGIVGWLVLRFVTVILLRMG